MTLKQQIVLERLPANNLNIAKSMRDAGYSPQSCRSGTLYARLRKKIDDIYQPEQIKAKIVKAEKKFIKDNDNSNYARMLELQAKITGLTQDKTQQGVAVFIDTKAEQDARRVIEEDKQLQCKGA